MGSEPQILEKRERILNAAIGVFAERGFHDCRVSDIAKAAGVSHGLVYHYFESKDDVLRSIYRDRWSLFLELARQRLAEERTAVGRLENTVSFVVDVYRANPDLMRVLLQDLPVGASSFIHETTNEAIDIIALTLEEGIASGEFRQGLEPRLAARIFYGGLQATLSGWVWDGVVDVGDSAKDELRDVLLTGLVPRSAAAT